MLTSYIFPVRLKAHHGESILGYLRRLAAKIGANSVASIVQELGAPKPIKDLPMAPSLSALALALDDQWLVLAKGHLIPQGDDFVLNGSRVDFNLIRSTAMWICPECLAAEPFHRHIWYFAPLNACHIHHRVLLGKCPDCARIFEWNHVGFEACPGCKLPYASMRGASVDQRSIRAMVVMEEIAEGRQESVVSVLSPLTIEDRIELLIFLGRLATKVEGDEYQPGTVMKASSKADLAARGVALVEDWPTEFFKYLDSLAEKNTDKPIDAITRLDPVHIHIEKDPDMGWHAVTNAAFREYLANRDFFPARSGRLQLAGALLSKRKAGEK